MRKGFFLLLTVLTACAGSSARMTQDRYDSIQTGVSMSVVEQDIGQPYAIHNKSGGVKEYEYIERITMGTQLISEQHYYLIVVDGKVMGKYTKQEKAPPYDLIYQDDPNHHWYP